MRFKGQAELLQRDQRQLGEGIDAMRAFVEAWSAVLIGAVAGILVVASAVFIEEHLRIDDPVGAVSVHGACGLWGTVALDLFANGKYGAGWNSVGAYPRETGLRA